MKEIRILYINGSSMGLGGVSAFLMNYYRLIDKSRFHVDFCCLDDSVGFFDDEIRESGSQVFNIPSRSQNFILNHKYLVDIIKNGKYDIVHSNADSSNYYVLKIASKCNVPVRISHSHNTDYTKKKLVSVILNNAEKRRIPYYATNFFSCSVEANKWLHGENVKFDIISNAVDLDRFKFSEDARQQVRIRNGIDDETKLIGAIGRLDYQKNHAFLISSFAKYVKKNPKAKLMIVGDGVLKKKLLEESIKTGVSDRIIFTGEVKDTSSYYSAFDVFAMPSLFEGLGIVAVEAQCNGLPCILSNCMEEYNLRINENVMFLPLETSKWADSFDMMHRVSGDHSLNNAKVSPYNIQVAIQKMETLYIDLYNNARRKK